MPTSLRTKKRSDPTGQDEAARDLSAKIEELQAEIDALRRENAELIPADSEHKRVKERTANLGRSNIQLQIEIEERNLAEGDLQESEEQFRRAIEDAPIPIIMHAEDGEVLQISRTWTELTGYTLQDVPTFDAWLTSAYGEGADAVRDHMQALFKGDKRSIGIEFPVRTRDGRTRHWSFSASSPGTLSDGRRFIIGMAVDITERKRAEEALLQRTEDLARLQSELEVTNREANLYLDILTHDIRNTENVSSLYAELLADTLDGEATGYIEKLQRSIQKSIEILKTVSTIRRIHRASPELKPMDLDRAIRGTIEEFPTSIIRYDGACYQVRADDLLSVIFNNLIGNAVKHGGPGVEIAVRVEEQNGDVLITVEDTGPGVPDGDKEAIFHRYEQKKRGVGEGLGLYLVQILVERYGGKIWADDRVPGRSEDGAAFRFTVATAAEST